MNLSKCVAGLGFALAATSASAVSIDFTDTSIWMDETSTQKIGGVTVSISANASPLTVALGGAPGPVGPLVGLSDGFGIGNDEITRFPNKLQSATVEFSKPVRIIGLYFLDLFKADDGSDLETVSADFSNGASVTTNAIEFKAEGIGFASNFFNAITADSVRFTPGVGNDAEGQPDFALAGVEISVIPLPSSVLLFTSALLGMGLLARKNRKAAAV